MGDQQLVARIKRSSEYWGQTPKNRWFDVEIAGDDFYRVRGNNNRYRVCDVRFGIHLTDGNILDLTSGKTSQGDSPKHGDDNAK